MGEHDLVINPGHTGVFRDMGLADPIRLFRIGGFEQEYLVVNIDKVLKYLRESGSAQVESLLGNMAMEVKSLNPQMKISDLNRFRVSKGEEAYQARIASMEISIKFIDQQLQTIDYFLRGLIKILSGDAQKPTVSAEIITTLRNETTAVKEQLKIYWELSKQTNPPSD